MDNSVNISSPNKDNVISNENIITNPFVKLEGIYNICLMLSELDLKDISTIDDIFSTIGLYIQENKIVLDEKDHDIVIKEVINIFKILYNYNSDQLKDVINNISRSKTPRTTDVHQNFVDVNCNDVAKMIANWDKPVSGEREGS